MNLIIVKAKANRRYESLRECEEEGDDEGGGGANPIGSPPLPDPLRSLSLGVCEVVGEVGGRKEADPSGSEVCESVGEVVGPKDAGPGVGRGAAEALH
jgi:hypothetical protein